MSVVMTGNYIFVQPGQRCFRVASNLTNYLELGVRGATEYYLECRIDAGEFIINATLLDPTGRKVCEVVNNFPQGPDCRKEMTRDGYRILTCSDELLLGIEANGDICTLKGTVYGNGGAIIAKDKDEDFLIFRGPAVLGKSNGSLGIVLR